VDRSKLIAGTVREFAVAQVSRRADFPVILTAGGKAYPHEKPKIELLNPTVMGTGKGPL
jgi:hypothetical protein